MFLTSYSIYPLLTYSRYHNITSSHIDLSLSLRFMLTGLWRVSPVDWTNWLDVFYWSAAALTKCCHGNVRLIPFHRSCTVLCFTFCFILKWSSLSFFLKAISAFCLALATFLSLPLFCNSGLTFMLQRINSESTLCDRNNHPRHTGSAQLFSLAEQDAALRWTSTVLCRTIQPALYSAIYFILNKALRQYWMNRATRFTRGIILALKPTEPLVILIWKTTTLKGRISRTCLSCLLLKMSLLLSLIPRMSNSNILGW